MKRIFLLAVFMALYGNSSAAVKSAMPAAEQQLGFARQLAAEKDFDKAALEFERFAAYFPEDPRREEALASEIKALAEGQVWKKAGGKFQAFRKNYPASRESDALSLLLLRGGDGEEEDSGLNPAAELPLIKDPQIRQDVRMIQVLHLVQDKNWEGANAAMKEYLAEFPSSDRALKVRKALALNDPLPRFPKRSGGLAALFSLVLPGSGQIYLGHPDRGIALAGACGFLGWAAAESWNKDLKAQGLIWGTFTLAAYVAQAGGAARAAGGIKDRAEERHKEKILEILKDRTEQGEP